MNKFLYIAMFVALASCTPHVDSTGSVDNSMLLAAADSLRSRADSLINAAQSLSPSGYRPCFMEARTCRAKALDIVHRMVPPPSDSADIAELQYLDSRIAMLDSLEIHLIID